MELDWSTFFLEILNFLVLAWVLKRFLYTPVLDIIARRRQGIEATLADAQRQRETGAVLQRQYENRLVEWEEEKATARKALDVEMEEERSRQQQALKTELAAERVKAQVLEQKDREEREQQLEAKALELGARFVTRLLKRIAAPEVEHKLVEVAVHDLHELSLEQQEALQHAFESEEDSIEVTSARALDANQRRVIEEELGHLVKRTVSCHYHEDPNLIAGLRIRVGPWRLQANLADELKSFAEAGR